MVVTPFLQKLRALCPEFALGLVLVVCDYTFRSLALQRPTYRRRSYVASVSTEIPEVGWVRSTPWFSIYLKTILAVLFPRINKIVGKCYLAELLDKSATEVVGYIETQQLNAEPCC